MSNERSNKSQLASLSYLAQLMSVSDLDQLIDAVIEITPRILGAAGCSVYLIPELVPEYNGTLVDSDGKIVDDHRVENDIIVLAANSRPKTRRLIGKAFYARGQGLTGWVFEHSTSLRIMDMQDALELHAIHPELCWSDRYGGSQYYYGAEGPKPTLIVPLVADQRTIGVLKSPATIDGGPFTEEEEEIAKTIAQILAGVIRRAWIVQEQGRRIYKLVEISGRQEGADAICRTVTESLGEMLNSRCRSYMRLRDGTEVELTFDSGIRLPDEERESYARSEDLIGWVFQTAKPLRIADARDYRQEQVLDDRLLAQISDGARINEQDHFLNCGRLDCHLDTDRPVPFLAVPITATDGSVYGVLRVGGANDELARRTAPFGRGDLQLAQSFASTISVAIENDRDRRLGFLLTNLGYYSDPERLYDMAFEQIPTLIAASECCIYALEKGPERTYLRPVRPRNSLVGISYDVGEGKTGFCALAQDTLVVNHYGTGMVAYQAMADEKGRIAATHRNDLVTDHVSESGQRVGIIQLRRGLEASQEARDGFERLALELKTKSDGALPSPKRERYGQLGLSPSCSFVATPVKTELSELYGVITMRRRVPGFPFSPEDVTLLEGIARRLASVMHVLAIQKERQQLLMTLAHEINTPLTGVLADSENLKDELTPDSETKDMSEHLLGQVLRLQLLTETIMAVLAGESPSREFSIHSIYRPVIEAVQLFESEAREKGCDFRKIRHVGPGGGFPDIQMSLFDLGIAFKNIMHNAVKYSFSSRKSGDENRYISVFGRWVDDEHYAVSIQNYGVGINQEEIDRSLIFEPGYRGQKASDRRRTGAGFGLAHARQVVENLHNGHIEVSSRPLPGGAEPSLTTVTVTLPLTQDRCEPRSG